MDVDLAARRTMELALAHKDKARPPLGPDLSFEHLENMMERWPHDGSETKKCRWLGWMQCTVVALLHPVIGLEEMKQINMTSQPEGDPRRDESIPEPA